MTQCFLLAIEEIGFDRSLPFKSERSAKFETEHIAECRAGCPRYVNMPRQSVALRALRSVDRIAPHVITNFRVPMTPATSEPVCGPTRSCSGAPSSELDDATASSIALRFTSYQAFPWDGNSANPRTCGMILQRESQSALWDDPSQAGSHRFRHTAP
jgi:hypothetical protein